jgi:formate dehydrogenase major subunit
MYIAGENPAMSDPDQAHVKAALTKLPFLVVQDIFLTETAQFADIVLPAAAHAEKHGTYTNTNRQVQMARPVVPAPGEAKADYEITTLIAQAIGLNWVYTHPKDVFAEMASLMPSLQGITWERLEREEMATYPLDKEIIFDQGFPTTTGKAQLVATKFSPPHEVSDDAFPFVLTTGRLLEHWHTGAMTRRALVLDALESEPHVSLNPADAAHYPARVKITTRRGMLTLNVRQDKDIPRGMAFIPFAFHEAAANILTNPALDPFGKIPEFKYAAAKIEAV